MNGEHGSESIMSDIIVVAGPETAMKLCESNYSLIECDKAVGEASEQEASGLTYSILPIIEHLTGTLIIIVPRILQSWVYFIFPLVPMCGYLDFLEGVI